MLVLALLLLSPALLAGQTRRASVEPSVRRARLMRLLSRLDSLVRLDSLSHEADRRAQIDARAAVAYEGRFLHVVLQRQVPTATARAVVAGAESILTAFGAASDDDLRAFVLVQDGSIGRDSIMERLGRRAVQLDWFAVARPDSARGAWYAARGAAQAYRAQLDTVWQRWLIDEYGMVWTSTREGVDAMVKLVESDVRVGQECVAGSIAGCASWLGIDGDAEPLRNRYTPQELRLRLPNWPRTPDLQSCHVGSDDACLRYAEARAVDPVPAPGRARASLIRAVRELYGAEALRAALRDSTGTILSRFADAAGTDGDSLLTAWRTWVLSRGRPQRVRAGTFDVLSALVAAGVCVVLATRSGRWR